MKIKDKIKSYSFWVSLASAVILILKLLGNRFGFTVDETMVSDLFTALCSILVLLGIIVVPNSQPVNITQQTTTKQLTKNKAKDISKNSNTATSSKTNSNEFETKESIITESQLSSTNEATQTIESNDSAENKLTITENLDFEITANSNKDNIIEGATNKYIDSTEQSEDYTSEHNITLDCSAEEHNEQIQTIFEQPMQTYETTERSTLNNEGVEEVKNTEKNLDTNPIETNPKNVSDLKEFFNTKRAEFSKNMNNYIFELQEEIRKAREQM